MDQTSMDLSSKAADANAAAGFELLAEAFYSGNKEESTAATLLLRRHYIMTRSSARSACTRPEGSLMRDFCQEALLQASCGNNRLGHLGRACHGNNPALLPMKTRLPKRIVPRDQSPSCSSAEAWENLAAETTLRSCP